MRIFVTGSTGFIGSALVPELIRNGHQVLGMTRSDAGESALTAAGAEVHRGDLDNLESLRKGAAKADAVIHLAFNHDFSKFVANCEQDRRAVETLAATLKGSNRPLMITSGTAIANGRAGKVATENDLPDPSNPNPRAMTERAIDGMVSDGINVAVMRLAQIHDPYKQGLVPYVIAVAREKGVSAYLGDGSHRWPAAHISDTARLYRLAIEQQEPGARYHAVAEEGVPMIAIAEVIGRGLNVPVKSIPADQAGTHFGWLGGFAAMDLTASSAITQKRLGWKPTGPTLLSDLEQMKFAAA